MQYYTLNDIAKALKVTRRTVDNWRKEGLFKVEKFGYNTRVSEEEYFRFLRIKKGE